MKKFIIASLMLLFAGSICSAAVHTVCKVEKNVEFKPVKELFCDLVLLNAPAFNVETVFVKIPSDAFATLPDVLNVETREVALRSWYREKLNSIYLPDKRKQIYAKVTEQDE